MIFTLEPLKAAEGDCLLLHFGTPQAPRLALIDGGPGQIWETSLLPRLQQIAANRNVQQLEIELAMLSHVDNDHAVGLKKLFRRLKSEVEDHIPVPQRLLRVKRLWHNTFNDVLGDSIDKYYRTLTATLQASTGGGAPNPALEEALARAHRDEHGGSAEEAAEIASDVALVMAGHGEGRDIRDSHEVLRANNEIAALNAPFLKHNRPALITTGNAPNAVDVAGLSFRILGPMQEEIEALQKAFDKYVQDKGLTAEAMLAAYSDKSVPNLSSIVCIVEAGGKRILLTGDARGDKIITGLEKAGLLVNGKFAVDVLKVPHHGSDRNTTAEFFAKIRAKHYVLSGDGKHGNPERDTVGWLIDSRKPTDRYTIVLTYPLAVIDAERRREVLKKHKPWVPAQHALADLIAARKAQGHKFKLVEGAPFKIDLGGDKVTW
ncbi:MAG: hypothetical protein EPO68_05270 [Planctomycetota bacterium]|nr:MAG: hypothetical protein EPO68_05270 [Planctomycetota bacterium]